jgi:hypothetical protein
MVYMAGDNGRYLTSMESEGYADLAEMKSVGSNDEVAILAQFDSPAGARRYYLTQGGRLEHDLVADLGPTNSGDPSVLEDFITWGMARYPSERTMLILWNHGSGWRDDDVYAPYRLLRHHHASLPPVPPSIAGRRASRAIFRSTVTALVEEEAQRLIRQQGIAQTYSAVLPPAWLVDDPTPWSVTRAIRRPPLTVSDLRPGQESSRPRAICFDDSSKDFLDTHELGAVLQRVVANRRRLDILGMDACLMSMIEVAYEIRTSVDIMVASEEAEPLSGWPYGVILRVLADYPEMTADDMAREIVDRYITAQSGGAVSDPATQSALDLRYADAVALALDELARPLIGAIRTTPGRGAVLQARVKAQTFYDRDYVDLYDFASLLASDPPDAATAQAASALRSLLTPGDPGGMVLTTGAVGPGGLRSHGLAIYFPLGGLSPFYSNLALSRACAWYRFLEIFLAL